MYGNRYHLGNFDQCIEAPWYETHPNLRNQYCLADIVLERSGKVARKKINELNNPYQSALDRLEVCFSLLIKIPLDIIDNNLLHKTYYTVQEFPVD